MGWMLPAAMVASSVIGAASQSGSDSKAGGQPMYTMANLPADMQNRLVSQMNSMPVGLNVNFGGQSFPGMYGPQMRAINTLYNPQGAIPYQSPQPSALAGAMIASAPLMWRAANQVQQQQQMQPTGAYWPTAGYGGWGGADYLYGGSPSVPAYYAINDPYSYGL